jgi:predicted nucleic acid-binding protein
MSADKPSPPANPGTAKASLARLVELAAAGEEIVFTRSGRPVAKFKPSAKSPRTFLDTNILFYCDDHTEPAKQRTALDLIRQHRQQRTGVVSLQILQEYFVAVTKKLKLDAAIARNKVEIYSKFTVAEPTVTDILAAIDLHRLHGFSYYDALVLHMAKQAGCRILLSEDMQHRQEVDGVRIINPFL